MNWDSFFDDPVTPEQPFTIWKRIGDSEDLGAIEKEKTVFECFFLKSEAGSQELKERYFILKPNYLLYRKVIASSSEQRLRRNEGVPVEQVRADQDILT